MANFANLSRFGDPLSPGWQQNNLTEIQARNGQKWQVHKDAASAFQGLLGDLEAAGYNPTSSGGFNYRSIRGAPGTLSQHAFGNAVDINAGTNPLGSMSSDMPPNIGELAQKHGLEWGGNWKSRPDPMHFEWTGGSPMASAFNDESSKNMTPMMAAMKMPAANGKRPALSPDASLSDKFIAGGPGALFGAPNGVFDNAQGEPGYDLGTGLQGAGTYLMGISDPKALSALSAINKDTADYTVTTGADGSLIRVNKRTGAVERITGAGPTDAQKEYDKSQAKSFSDMNTNIPAEAQKSAGKLGQVQQLRELFANPNVYQGAGGEWVQQGKKIGNALGMDFNGVADADVARALANQMTLEIRSVANGAGMPGSLSDKDLAFLKASAPGLDNSREANAKLLDYYEKLHRRAGETEGLRQQYVAQHGRLDEGFNRVLGDFANKNVLFGDADKYAPMPTGRGDRQPLSSFKR